MFLRDPDLGEAVCGLCEGPPHPHPPSHAGLCAAPAWGRQQTRRQRAGGPLPSCGRQQCDEQPPRPSSTSAQKQGALPTTSLSTFLWRRCNLDSPRLQPEAPLLICHWQTFDKGVSLPAPGNQLGLYWALENLECNCSLQATSSTVGVADAVAQKISAGSPHHPAASLGVRRPGQARVI